MNAKRNASIAIVATIILISTISTVSAQPADEMPGMEKQQQNKERWENLVEELDLTFRQWRKIRNYLKANEGKIKAWGEQLLMKKAELKTEIEKIDTDKEKINTIASDIKNLLGRIMDQGIEYILSIKGILTPEQFVKFREKMEEESWLKPNRIPED